MSEELFIGSLVHFDGERYQIIGYSMRNFKINSLHVELCSEPEPPERISGTRLRQNIRDLYEGAPDAEIRKDLLTEKPDFELPPAPPKSE